MVKYTPTANNKYSPKTISYTFIFLESNLSHSDLTPATKQICIYIVLFLKVSTEQIHKTLYMKPVNL